MLTPVGVQVLGTRSHVSLTVLTQDALLFLAELHRLFDSTRRDLLTKRLTKQRQYDQGKSPDFLAETEWIRESNWKGPSIPGDLLDRRVEITGPVDAKMIINALNSDAKVFMADFEDSCAPTWDNLIQGQIALIAANKRSLTASSGGKKYALRKDKPLATLMVRPRGWHLNEEHVYVDGQPVSASLFDFALYFYHNAKIAIDRGSGPYFYLPKMESYLEARLWNSVFVYAQSRLEIPQGTIRATCLIETLPAAFEMNEIIYELREHSAGLNCGRWDYIFNFIKIMRSRKNLIFPDRGTITMDRPFLSAYVRLLIKTCHRRGVHAMGGMSAFIPIKNDEAANNAVLDKVRKDKLAEVKAGHDGTWVAHPGLIEVVSKIFNEHMPGPNQLHVARDDVQVGAAELFNLGKSFEITEAGLRGNIDVSLKYIEAWLNGLGCVPIHNLMEDAATAEISRSQIWQWIHHGAKLNDGRLIDLHLVSAVLKQTVESIRQSVGDAIFEKSKFPQATVILTKLLFEEKLSDFLTLEAYPSIVVKSIQSNL